MATSTGPRVNEAIKSWDWLTECLNGSINAHGKTADELNRQLETARVARCADAVTVANRRADTDLTGALKALDEYLKAAPSSKPFRPKSG